MAASGDPPVNLSTPVKALAFVVFIAAIAGATYGVQVYLGDNVVQGAPVGVQPARATLNGTAGHTATYALTLENRGDAQQAFSAQVLGAEGAVLGEVRNVTLAPGASATAFVPVSVPATQAPGDAPLTVVLLDAEGQELRRREGALTLRVLPPASPGFAPGETAVVLYTGRIADSGRVFNTNDPALQNLNFPRTETYRFSPGTFTVETDPRPTVVQGFYEALLGMQPGESRTVTFPPEKGYGNATQEEVIERERTLERRETLELPEAPLSMTSFAEYLNGTEQGTPDQYEVGSFVVSERNGERLRYRVIEKTEEGVTLRLHVEVGETYTIYDFWPNASRVESVNETSATFLTTPTTAEGEPFTFFPYWPDASRVVRMDDDTIVVRHDPTEGLKYTQAQGQFQPPTSYTVVRVTDTEIVVSTPSQNPLAGRALTFDILLLNVQK